MITLPSWRHVVREPPHGGPAHGRDYHTHLLPGVDLWGTDLHDLGQLERHILPASPGWMVSAARRPHSTHH